MAQGRRLWIDGFFFSCLMIPLFVYLSFMDGNAADEWVIEETRRQITTERDTYHLPLISRQLPTLCLLERTFTWSASEVPCLRHQATDYSHSRRDEPPALLLCRER